eukprot:TRINITY_DN1853_c0_g1_i1.p1 TRINITY_DN1853_c0_g1~~TRINITY_DN1853_c0_g1_i1.p1  ORF type:complete len:221 (+),score=44.36 TRINITY_DN1853_c0_g1_i1:291-953(+)
MSRDKEKCKNEIKEILATFSGKVTETAETANFITNYGDDGKTVMLHSVRRTDAVILEAMLHVEPMNKLCPKVTKGLLAHRVRGRWASTQENCFILLALDKYFQEYEKDEPDYAARLWYGEDFAGQQEFKGRSVDTNEVEIPMKTVQEGGDRNLIIQKEGIGRLYYRIGMNYAPTDLFLKELNYGFQVERVYEGVDSADHVSKDEKGNLALRNWSKDQKSL